ncbi:MAG TPA: hypothetical protein PLS50_04560, partial [Candidatus Dojkabacteria bacterium]|nr:hypothetical protein [Candidatus Dojkabacteria bacterium]
GHQSYILQAKPEFDIVFRQRLPVRRPTVPLQTLINLAINKPVVQVNQLQPTTEHHQIVEITDDIMKQINDRTATSQTKPFFTKHACVPGGRTNTSTYTVRPARPRKVLSE